jgi:hypothetical protein
VVHPPPLLQVCISHNIFLTTDYRK